MGGASSTGSASSPPVKRLEYLCSCDPRGPNAACCLARRRTSSGEGGWKRVMGRSSTFDFSPVAVVRLMVGRERDGIEGEGGRRNWWPGCKCACGFCRLFCVFEKKFVSLFECLLGLVSTGAGFASMWIGVFSSRRLLAKGVTGVATRIGMIEAVARILRKESGISGLNWCYRDMRRG